MRVLFISLHSLNGHQPWARRSLNIIQALADAGNTVTVLAPQQALEVSSDRVVLRPLCGSAFPDFRLLSFWDAFVKASVILLGKKVDAVHFAGSAVFLYTLLKAVCRAPVVYDVWRSAADNHRDGRWYHVLRERLEKAVLRRMDTITCSCPMLEEEFARQKEISRVCLLENAVSAAHSAQSDLGQHPVVVYEHPGRDVSSIAQVLRIGAKLRERLPDVRFIICTELNPHWRKLVDLMERLELREHCQLRPFGSTAEQASLLASASVLLLPESRGGYVDERIIRYMQSGTPIVATRIKSYTQFLSPSCAVLTAVGVDDLAEGLARVLYEPLLSAGMAREAQAYAVAHFTRSSFNRKVRAVYNELRG